MANITQEWLEEVFGEKIESFVVKSGSNPGDGYTSVLYTVEVHFPESDLNNGHEDELEDGKFRRNKQKTPFNILVKAYPVHAARQEFLSQSNMFQKELVVYNSIVPELIKFQKNNKNKSLIRPPFPDFIYGKAVDYKNLPKDESKYCVNPLDNCIVMPDLRVEGGYRLANRLVGFDVEHCKLVIQAQAKLHALSWAYKLLTNTESFKEKFPALANTFFDDMDSNMTKGMFDNNYGMFRSVIEDRAQGAQKEELLKSLERSRNVVDDVMALFFSDTLKLSDPSVNKDNIMRVPQPHKDNEEPWSVLIHGDSWLNNMLFRYDDTADKNKPTEVILVDLQIMREGDPMTDLVYSIYTSTTSDIRKAHLNDLLKLYTLTFIQVCEHFQVTPLPGFQLSEVQKRFHRAKCFGFLMCIVGLPIFLKDPENAPNLEEMREDLTQEEFIENFSKIGVDKGDDRFGRRVFDVVTDLYEQGVI